MMSRCLLLLVWFASLGSAHSGPPAIDERLKAAQDPAGRMVLVAAHRGGYESDKEDRAPENTVANLEVAIRKGYDVYETDIQRTRDGVFVIVHDPTIERETTGTGTVDQLTWNELRALKKRYRDGSISEESVATLEELLLAGKGRILFKPDLKPGVINHFDELARLVVRLEMQHQVLIRTGLKDRAAIQDCFRSGTPKLEIMFKLNTAKQVQIVHLDFQPFAVDVNIAKGEPISDSKRAAIEEALNLGILVHSHSYGDAAQNVALAEAGVRMFHTASPAKTLRWLTEQDWR